MSEDRVSRLRSGSSSSVTERLMMTVPGLRGLRLIERHARLYRRMWLLVAAGAAEPLFYMLSVGVGIGGLIGTVAGPGGQPVPYREFVAPGLLAVSALNGALADSTFNIFGRLKFDKLYDAVLTTPLGAADVAVAEIGWAVLRGLIYSVTFLAVIAAMGLVVSPWALLALPAAALISFATAALGVFLTTYMSSWQDLDYVLLVAVPLFLFSGTFYPLSVYPRVIADIVRVDAAVPGRRAAARPGARGAGPRSRLAGRLPGRPGAGGPGAGWTADWPPAAGVNCCSRSHEEALPGGLTGQAGRDKLLACWGRAARGPCRPTGPMRTLPARLARPLGKGLPSPRRMPRPGRPGRSPHECGRPASGAIPSSGSSRWRQRRATSSSR